MADLRTDFLGVKSPNPFWLASAPPTDRKVNVERAFRAGWGGVVWKTLGEAGPPIVNVSGARYGAIHGPDRRLIAMNNIELITDRELEINLIEIKEVKRAWPDRALIVSLMVPCDEESWKAILARVEETECDGVELNFGCPHGMSERGMGSAVGQVPEYVEMVTRWCKAHSRMPVIVKLTPNITDVRQPARAAKKGGADSVSLINTINSIMNIDLDHMTPDVAIDGKGTHGGMCGPAVKPIALSMVSEIARDPACAGLPISAIGGITTWRDAAEFIALGAGTVQVCTAAMTYGFKIVEEMTSGLKAFMEAKGYSSIEDFRGRAVPSITDWQYLNLNFVAKAEIDQDLCIKCGRCHIVCEDTSHQAIFASLNGQRKFVVNEAECVGCNLCVLVCPVEGCISLVHKVAGVDPRTGLDYARPPANWTTHPNNPGGPREGGGVRGPRASLDSGRRLVLQFPEHRIDVDALLARLGLLRRHAEHFELTRRGRGWPGGGDLRRNQRLAAIVLDLGAFLGGAIDLEIEIELRAEAKRHRVHRLKIGRVPMRAVANGLKRMLGRPDETHDLRILQFGMVAQQP